MNTAITRILFLIVLLLPVSGFSQIKVRAAYGTPSLSQVVFPLGVQAGRFGRHGITVEPLYIAGRSINLLLSGDVQFGFTGADVYRYELSARGGERAGKIIGSRVQSELCDRNH